MIKFLTIRNFKSIRNIRLDCKKMNVIIGEPNSGKSNIIEALALQSQNAFNGKGLNHDIFRYKDIGDLFFDFKINTPIEVVTDNRITKLSYPIRNSGVPENQFHYYLDIQDPGLQKEHVIINHDGTVSRNSSTGNTNVHYYDFRSLMKFERGYMPHLEVPFGENLPSLLLANDELKKWVSDFLREKKLTLTIKPTENDLAVSKLVDNEIYSYPYFTISETLQRVIFYNVAIKSNSEAVLLFDEPESNTFPFYTKFIAERMALDKSNQFFITTHNPYLLLNLIEKTEMRNLNVCIAVMRNYETELVVLNEDQISQVLDLSSDVFFNFDQILEK